MRSERRRVAVLGATGVVGQRLVRRVSDHPWFELVAVAASSRSVGRSYSEAAPWHLEGEPPPAVARLPVLPVDPSKVDAEIVLSALDAATAAVAEPAFRAVGRTVVSNASALRLEPEVPLVVPEVNPDHVDLVADQHRRWGGAVVANPNCSTIGLALSLAVLDRAFGLQAVVVTTLQALSGAGHPGVSSLDALGNVVPWIQGEEDKLVRETPKIFGRVSAGMVVDRRLPVSAQCNRVPVRDGHMLSVAVRTVRPASPAGVRRAFETFRSPLAGLGLPSAPYRPVVPADRTDRPQPVPDRDRSGGMAVTVGRVEACPVMGVRYVALVHNTERGAAGGTVLLAELLVARGLA